MATEAAPQSPANPRPSNFIRDIVDRDNAAGTYGGRIVTRFPPEPNGYMHIGHAKSVCLNFGLAAAYGGVCHLRMDDTDPTKEDVEYVEAMQRDVRWLGFEWDAMFYASDYFERLYELAEELIRKGRAYVCSLSEEDMRRYRGTVTEPGRPSPGRERSVEENLELFRRMRAGELPDGSHTLRARIDMANPNMKMRDPPLYRIRHVSHYRHGDKWCIYPMYDFTHCLSDAIENITHSICTLEFENNRELYDWVLEACDLPKPRPKQLEFARLNLTYTVMSKRKLLQLVTEGHVRGWDDPRMPTIAGMRRRGYTPEALRDFCDRIGVAKANSMVDVAQLEAAVRDDLNARSPRVLAVLKPLKVILDNYPEGEEEQLDAPYWPHDIPKEGSRKLPFSKVLYIEQDDFMETPVKGFFRLAPGKEVRLRYAYFIRCERIEKDAAGNTTALHCTYDPQTRGGNALDGRKVKGTIHWVSAMHAITAEVRLFDRLMAHETPDATGEGFLKHLNPESLVTTQGLIEPSLATAKAGEHYQFERTGFFIVDADSTSSKLVFNRTVALRDSWAKQQQRPNNP